MNAMRSFLGLSLLASAAFSQAALLYDATSGMLPDSWGWAYGSTGGEVKSVSGGALNVSTLATPAIQMGYGITSPVSLSPGGVQIRFEMALDAEDHSPASADKNGDGLADRAGFSLIAIGSDQIGVELGFWGNEIWAQQDSPLFIHSPTLERAAYSTSAMTVYDLFFSGGTYTLQANGSTILTGSRKDYSAFAGFPDPYETPNFLFFGDNTSSASAAYRLRNLSVNPVPEPASLAVLVLGLGFLRRKRNQK